MRPSLSSHLPPRLPRMALPAPLLALLALSCAAPARVPPRADAQVARGYGYLSERDLERAEVAFRHALAFAPALPEAENGLGIVAVERGDRGEARRHFERAVAARAEFAEGRVNLALLHLADGRHADAEEELRAALRIDPDMLAARLGLARALLHRGRAEPARRADLWRAARREYLHLLEAHPDDADAHHDLGYLAFEQGDLAGAEESYRRAVAAATDRTDALHGLCIALVRLDRCGEALASCGRCLEVDPGNAACEKSRRGALACAAP